MLNFDAANHVYTYDGQRVPSVTQVLDVLNDFSKVPWQALEAAKQRGRLVHEAGELLLNECLDWSTVDADIRPYVEGLQLFLEQSGFVPIQTETQLYSQKYGFAGTVDAAGYWRNGICLCDWKTSVVMPKTVAPQLSAYRELYNENGPSNVRRIYCVRLTKDGGYKVDKIEGAEHFSIFKSCLNLWRYTRAA